MRIPVIDVMNDREKMLEAIGARRATTQIAIIPLFRQQAVSDERRRLLRIGTLPKDMSWSSQVAIHGLVCVVTRCGLVSLTKLRDVIPVGVVGWSPDQATPWEGPADPPATGPATRCLPSHAVRFRWEGSGDLHNGAVMPTR